ncbi:MAG: TonB-dependent receptor [Mangrovibacterium sp.]
MKHILKRILLVILFMASQQLYAQSLSGTITDANTHKTMPGVRLYFPDIKKGTITDENGAYTLEKLPKSKLTLQVSFIGYQSISKSIDLNQTKQLNFEMQFAVTEMSELVVTGQAGHVEKRRTPSPISLVPKKALLESSGTNIIDALAKEPGVSQITTGAGISKPVIRGLGYNRVVVVNDGIRQEGQQWGDEHGIEIDEYSVDHVEILKGPASLAFGSDAMAGVINMLSAPTLPKNTVQGNAIFNYQTNNNLIGYSGGAQGNNNDWIWGVRVSGKRAQDFHNKIDGAVDNSSFSDNAANIMFGKNRKNGYTHLNMGVYNVNPSIPSLTEHDHEEEDHDHLRSEEDTEEHHHLHEHSQEITHYKASLENRDYLGKNGKLTETIGFQQNRRKEFEEDEIALYMRLNTLNYDVKYEYQTANNWDFTSGIGGMYQNSENFGTEYLVPDYNLFDIGLYFIAHKQWEKWDISGGFRYDHRHSVGDELHVEEEHGDHSHEEEIFAGFNKNFSGLSGSIGATYQISDKAYTKLNLSRGYRAPNVAELGSNGSHEGSYQYQLGNVHLKPEYSFQINWGIGIQSQHVAAELNLFSNHISNYIYNHKLQNIAGSDSIIDENPAYQYAQDKAHLYGGELFIDYHPHAMHWLHIQNTLSYTRGRLTNQADSMSNLPMIPPLCWQPELKFDLNRLSKITQNSFISIGLDVNAAQNHYFSAYNTETVTPAYTLINASVGTDFVNKKNKTICSLYISGNNLANKAYQNHLNRLKYAGHNEETGKEGYYNMGRNISFKLIVPFGY